jgi:hypothetical protein
MPLAEAQVIAGMYVELLRVLKTNAAPGSFKMHAMYIARKRPSRFSSASV